VAENGFPKELGMMKFAAGPILEMVANKARNIDDAGARELIDAVHSLSAKLEIQTGEHSQYHYESDSE
jgi:hypothetical protein